jgi:(E)-4-hydroxy-3-methylbut-2-enyl-diphosphate synthase
MIPHLPGKIKVCIVKRIQYSRTAREVMVGSVGIGGSNPVRVQTMTSTPTSDITATVQQVRRIASAGADIVRMTVRNKKEAENLSEIKRELRAGNCNIPLVADVHFNPAIAEIAAAIVDKVRINPGNYGISPGRGRAVLSDEASREELQSAKVAFSRLLGICRSHGTALRIGVNHGSLSPRIIDRYGNTPEGMVNSAMEFLHFCAEEDFHEVVVSLKSSNTLVMVRANQMMADYMEKEGLMYPLHLGVTEAGEGEDGRIRSVAGIGTLLSAGLGDTIRISLTEEPEREIPVARKLLRHIEKCSGKRNKAAGDIFNIRQHNHPASVVENMGGDKVPVVIGEMPVGGGTGNIGAGSPAADYLFDRGLTSGISSRAKNSSVKDPKIIVPASLWHDRYRETPGIFPLAGSSEYLSDRFSSAPLLFLQAALSDLTGELLAKASVDQKLAFIALSQTLCPLHEMEEFITKLKNNACRHPVIFKKEYDTDDGEDFQIPAAADFAPLFMAGKGNGIWLADKASGNPGLCVSTAFSILQSARVRTSKTEFISCPSCGRTMFNIQKATAAVKQRTSHLSGLTIAVMGCIVNGPGEMADADYGYVGSGRGMVSLYKGQAVIKRNVPEDKAVDELISLIRESGDWADA